MQLEKILRGGCMGELLNLKTSKSIYCEYYKGLFEWAAKKIYEIYNEKLLGEILELTY
ncbi:MAG: hypothetical protein QW244_00605 [Candidatus Pacearchaeota archaeon]